MNIKTKNNFKKNTVNFFGTIGYFFSSIQWLWAIILYSSLITGLAKIMEQKPSSNVVKANPVIDISSSIPMMIITAIIVIFMSVLTIYILIKIPSTLIKASKKIVHEAAENVAPMVLKAQNKKDTKRNHIKLTPLLILIMKIILTLSPVVLAFTSQFIEKQAFDFFIAVYVSAFLACFSLLFFVFQYLSAGLMSVKKQDIW